MEILSGFVTRPLYKPGTQKVHPLSGRDFRVGHGEQTTAQKVFGAMGRFIGTGTTKEYTLRQPVPPQRYLPHNCWPWVICECHAGHPPARRGPRTLNILNAGPRSNDDLSGTREPGERSSVRLFQPPRVDAAGNHYNIIYSPSFKQESTSPSTSSNTQTQIQTRRFDSDLYEVSTRAHRAPVQTQRMRNIFHSELAPELIGKSWVKTPDASLTGFHSSAMDGSYAGASSENTNHFSTQELSAALQESRNQQKESKDIVFIQQRLEQALKEYKREVLLPGSDSQSSETRSFQTQRLLEVLTVVFSDTAIYIPNFNGEAQYSEEFVIILSTVEAIIGDVELYGVKLMPVLADRQLNVFVEHF
jgi:hypothetical protein